MLRVHTVNRQTCHIKIVQNADGNQREERITDSQIMGVVLNAERGDEIRVFRKASMNIDAGSVVEKGISMVQGVVNRISGLFNRKSRD